MNKKQLSTFVEICIYEVKLEKRTHRPCSFGDAKKGSPPIKLTKKPRSYTYALYWELDKEAIHGKATKSGLEKYYREFNRCLVTAPKMILEERIK